MKAAIIAFARLVTCLVLFAGSAVASALAQSERFDLIADAKQRGKKGDVSSQHFLCEGYVMGEESIFKGFQTDYEEALKWCTLASEQGYASSQALLGSMYETGRGTSKDYGKALKWYRLSAAQGHPDGKLLLVLNGIEEKHEKELKETRIAAEKGEAYAQFNLGVKYAGGEGVPQNYKEAAKWFRFAAERGVADAQYNLALMYKDGEGVAQEDKEAVKWFRLAAKQGYAKAQNNLGAMYGEGKGIPQNYREAYIWYLLAAANGDEKALDNRKIVEKKLTPFDLSQAQDEAAKRMAEIEARQAQ